MSRIKGIGFSTTGGRDLERLDQTLDRNRRLQALTTPNSPSIKLLSSLMDRLIPPISTLS